MVVPLIVKVDLPLFVPKLRQGVGQVPSGTVVVPDTFSTPSAGGGGGVVLLLLLGAPPPPPPQALSNRMGMTEGNNLLNNCCVFIVSSENDFFVDGVFYARESKVVLAIMESAVLHGSHTEIPKSQARPKL